MPVGSTAMPELPDQDICHCPECASPQTGVQRRLQITTTAFGGTHTHCFLPPRMKMLDLPWQTKSPNLKWVYSSSSSTSFLLFFFQGEGIFFFWSTIVKCNLDIAKRSMPFRKQHRSFFASIAPRTHILVKMKKKNILPNFSQPFSSMSPLVSLGCSNNQV